jgi:hypothetical protein
MKRVLIGLLPSISPGFVYRTAIKVNLLNDHSVNIAKIILKIKKPLKT